MFAILNFQNINVTKLVLANFINEDEKNWYRQREKRCCLSSHFHVMYARVFQIFLLTEMNSTKTLFLVTQNWTKITQLTKNIKRNNFYCARCKRLCCLPYSKPRLLFPAIKPSSRSLLRMRLSASSRPSMLRSLCSSSSSIDWS